MQGLLQIILHIVSIIVETVHKVILHKGEDRKDVSRNYSHKDYNEDRKEE